MFLIGNQKKIIIKQFSNLTQKEVIMKKLLLVFVIGVLSCVIIGCSGECSCSSDGTQCLDECKCEINCQCVNCDCKQKENNE